MCSQCNRQLAGIYYFFLKLCGLLFFTKIAFCLKCMWLHSLLFVMVRVLEKDLCALHCFFPSKDWTDMCMCESQQDRKRRNVYGTLLCVHCSLIFIRSHTNIHWELCTSQIHRELSLLIKHSRVCSLHHILRYVAAHLQMQLIGVMFYMLIRNWPK